ncbi:MAG: hypothetical protein JXA44_13325 [Methanospirillaceae archaeon]|nr:hypothetical protein [Methanospirillaceae archaeon]
MDDVIENGYTRLIEVIRTKGETIESIALEIRKKNTALFTRMIEMTAPVISTAGLQMLEIGKVDIHGEMYDTRHYDEKMILLGKSEEISVARPDDFNKKVTDQFCMLGESGTLYELMYSRDDLVVDSYRGELSPEDAIALYGYDIMYMLYKAMHQYCTGQEELVDALKKTLTFIYGSQESGS